MVSTSWCRKSICEPCISPAIMMVKPTPMATPAMPTSVWRTRLVTWVQAILNRRLVAMVRGPPSVVLCETADIAARVVDDRIDMRGDRARDHGKIGVARGGCDRRGRAG